MRLNSTFFIENDVLDLSKYLLGCTFHSMIDGVHCSGIITETEAYTGINDRASHAFGNRRTPRTEVMYRTGGISYVYFTYGLHHLFNVVTGAENDPHAVLIRAIYPLTGINAMFQRVGAKKGLHALSNGPAKLTKCLGITLEHNRMDLDGDLLWFEDNFRHAIARTVAGPRVGVDYAGEDALLPYRFVGFPATASKLQQTK